MVCSSHDEFAENVKTVHGIALMPKSTEVTKHITEEYNKYHDKYARSEKISSADYCFRR